MPVISTYSSDSNKEIELVTLFDSIYDAIDRLDRDRLYPLLEEINRFSTEAYELPDVTVMQNLVRGHKAFTRLMEDPYSHHAFTKPRGFAGDASLIDLFYGHGAGRQTNTEVGRFIFETLMQSPSCDAVRFRRGYYGAFIDRIALEKPERAKVLVLACGHLREALFSRAVTEKKVALVGIDSDACAVKEARRSLSGKLAEIRHSSIVDFIRSKSWGETYDFVYAAGLFDYLNDRIAARVVSTAFNALSPGGTISFANFLPSIRERGYMDIVMDWKLIYRTEDDMRHLASHLPEDYVAKIDVWTDPLDTVVYLTVTKNG